MNQRTQERYLIHHGIKGQKWGDRNGPPYPLDDSQASAAERRAGFKATKWKDRSEEEKRNLVDFYTDRTKKYSSKSDKKALRKQLRKGEISKDYYRSAKNLEVGYDRAYNELNKDMHSVLFGVRNEAKTGKISYYEAGHKFANILIGRYGPEISSLVIFGDPFVKEEIYGSEKDKIAYARKWIIDYFENGEYHY